MLLEREYDVLGGSGGRGARKGSIRARLTNILMELRKICNHPYMLPGAEDELLRRAQAKGQGRDGDTAATSWTQRQTDALFVNASGKFALLMLLLPALAVRSHRVLIFSQFCGVLTLLEDLMPIVAASCPPGTRGLATARIDGSTSTEKRQRIVDAFNRPDSTLFALLMTTRSGGQGINLAGADTVIIYDRWVRVARAQ